MTTLTYHAVRATQSPNRLILCFAASSSDLQSFATVTRVERDRNGHLHGFQRPEIASHIKEIEEYLRSPGAILPNSIVVAFIDRIRVTDLDLDGVCRVEIDTGAGPPGIIVDGQQRNSALRSVTEKPFQVFVSAVICTDVPEMRRQFVLINNTRPLPKALIHELLPSIDAPARFLDRTIAARLTDRLNLDGGSSLHGLINRPTNPTGIIRYTAIQHVILRSLRDGLMRALISREQDEESCFRLMSEFYQAVQDVFAEDWHSHTPRTSRLVHGAGIAAMGHVMETLALVAGARTRTQFAEEMVCLKGRTAWTSGTWNFAENDKRHWQAIQNVSTDIATLEQYLSGIVRNTLSKRHDPSPGRASREWSGYPITNQHDGKAPWVSEPTA